ncbi:hypothetical protein [Spirosoma utsteinense]|uniref:Uncharacterized protein n=1 Tax=Spirosoma utsteinense TaxID=2585773 RepID=A0ABR6W2T3_9BACT|nr:hypothetical protein [Spirosoma utsteinense]MBC3784304.1 hypothetical protein [Spirosoma utsteinense]MBC3790897.1 hypothetical protein [Spirosoma utsteinense]
MNTGSHLRLLWLTFILISASLSTKAQTPKLPIAPREGFWVVEWTPKSRQCTVRFYTDRQELIYEETLDQRINIARRQTKHSLNIALDQAMYVWNITHKAPIDRQWVAMQLYRK